jgi:hypothetical protein
MEYLLAETDSYGTGYMGAEAMAVTRVTPETLI